MSKIKILVNSSTQYGVGYYRIKQPFIKLAELFPDDFDVELNDKINYNDWDYLKNFNILYTHKTFVDYSLMESFVNECRKYGIKTVIDIDDYWDVSTEHPLYSMIKADDLARKILNNLKLVDYVTTTTPKFRDYILPYNKNVLIFPNAIDDKEKQWSLKEKPKNEFVKVLWGGGSSHLQDLLLLKDSFEILNSDTSLKGKYQIHLMGYDLRGTTTNLTLNQDFINILGSKGIVFDKNLYNKLNSVNFDLMKVPEIPKDIAQLFNGKAITKQTRDITPMESVWYEYEKIFTSNYKLIQDKDYLNFLNKFDIESEYPNQLEKQPYIRHKTENVYKFGENYKYGDFALAPIKVFGKIKDDVFQDNVSNRYQFAKSNLKLIEAGFHKLPVIASEIPIYTYDKEFVDGKNILFVKPSRQEKDWGSKIKRLINNPNQISDMGESAYELVKRKYHLDVVTNQRGEWLKTIV